MITTAYNFFIEHFFGDVSQLPLALQSISTELATIFAVFSVAFIVGAVISLVVFFFRYITSLGLR